MYDRYKDISKFITDVRKKFPYDLALIYIEKPNFITLDYWCTINNSQLDVTFEYKENQFFLRSFGAFDCIPDHWENYQKEIERLSQ